MNTFNAATTGEVYLSLTHHFQSNLRILATTLVIDKITQKTPSIILSSDIKNYFRDLTLADLQFYDAQTVDILLGVNLFLTLLNDSIVKRSSNLPFAKSSKLG